MSALETDRTLTKQPRTQTQNREQDPRGKTQIGRKENAKRHTTRLEEKDRNTKEEKDQQL
jgi:hypothetical protein